MEHIELLLLENWDLNVYQLSLSTTLKSKYTHGQGFSMEETSKTPLLSCFYKGVQTAKRPHYKRSIVIIINGEEYLAIEIGRSILEIYRELYLFEKWMLSRGFRVGNNSRLRS